MTDELEWEGFVFSGVHYKGCFIRWQESHAMYTGPIEKIVRNGHEIHIHCAWVAVRYNGSMWWGISPDTLVFRANDRDRLEKNGNDHISCRVKYHASFVIFPEGVETIIRPTAPHPDDV